MCIDCENISSLLFWYSWPTIFHTKLLSLNFVPLFILKVVQYEQFGFYIDLSTHLQVFRHYELIPNIFDTSDAKFLSIMRAMDTIGPKVETFRQAYIWTSLRLEHHTKDPNPFPLFWMGFYLLSDHYEWKLLSDVICLYGLMVKQPSMRILHHPRGMILYGEDHSKLEYVLIGFTIKLSSGNLFMGKFLLSLAVAIC